MAMKKKNGTMTEKNKEIDIMAEPHVFSDKDIQEKKKIDKEKPLVYLEIEIDGANKGRIIIELFYDRVPNTANNFRNLCKGFQKRGRLGYPGRQLHYKGSKFHLINKGLVALGGDYTTGDGTGGQFAIRSGDKKTFRVTDVDIGKHDEPYLLSMANHDNILTIGSQFFITFSGLPHLDGRHVVFGKVVDGIDILYEMERVPTTLGRPKVPIVIVGCGDNVQEIDRETCTDVDGDR